MDSRKSNMVRTHAETLDYYNLVGEPRWRVENRDAFSLHETIMTCDPAFLLTLTLQSTVVSRITNNGREMGRPYWHPIWIEIYKIRGILFS